MTKLIKELHSLGEAKRATKLTMKQRWDKSTAIAHEIADKADELGLKLGSCMCYPDEDSKDKWWVYVAQFSKDKETPPAKYKPLWAFIHAMFVDAPKEPTVVGAAGHNQSFMRFISAKK